MTEQTSLSVHRGLQVYVAVLTTALTISIAIIGFTLKAWHTEFVISQNDIHEIKSGMIQTNDNVKFVDYRITKAEGSIHDINVVLGKP